MPTFCSSFWIILFPPLSPLNSDCSNLSFKSLMCISRFFLSLSEFRECSYGIKNIIKEIFDLKIFENK